MLPPPPPLLPNVLEPFIGILSIKASNDHSINIIKLAWNCLLTITNLLQSKISQMPIINDLILQSVSILSKTTTTTTSNSTTISSMDYQKNLINIMTIGLVSQYLNKETSLSILDKITESPYKELFSFFLLQIGENDNSRCLKKLFLKIKENHKIMKLFWSLWRRIPSDSEVLSIMLSMDSPIFYRATVTINTTSKDLLKRSLAFLFVNAKIDESNDLSKKMDLSLFPIFDFKQKSPSTSFNEVYDYLFTVTLPLLKNSSQKDYNIFSDLITNFVYLLHLAQISSDNRLKDRLKRRFLQYLEAMSLKEWISIIEKDPLLLMYPSLSLPLHCYSEEHLARSGYQYRLSLKDNETVTREELERLTLLDFEDPFISYNKNSNTKKTNTLIISYLPFRGSDLLISWGNEVLEVEGFTPILDRFKELMIKIKNSIYKKKKCSPSSNGGDGDGGNDEGEPSKKEWWNKRLLLENEFSSLIKEDFFKVFANSIRNIINLKKENNLLQEKIIIQVDRYTHQFPWELVIPLNVMRTFNGNYLNNLKVPQKRRLGVLLNPSGDLDHTQKLIKEVLPEVRPLIMGRGILDVDERNSLLGGDYYMYFGHGSGSTFLRQIDPPSLSLIDRLGSFSIIEKEKVLPMAFLFGCSSGRISSYDDQSITEGSLLFFLRNGSPMVISNLWDITDRDHDRMCIEFLLDGRFDPENVSDNIIKAKRKCLFPLINGAATVVYC